MAMDKQIRERLTLRTIIMIGRLFPATGSTPHARIILGRAEREQQRRRKRSRSGGGEKEDEEEKEEEE